MNGSGGALRPRRFGRTDLGHWTVHKTARQFDSRGNRRRCCAVAVAILRRDSV
jgi:hypothetical protein